MDLFTLSAKLKMDSSDFDRGMKAAEESGGGLAGKLEKSFDTAKKAFKAVVSVAAVKTAVSAFVGLTNSAAAAGDTIDKQSQALGMSRKAYQEWDYILSQSGASIDSMGTSMKTLNAAIMDGGKDSKAALAQLGLSFRDLQMMNQEKQFEAVVEAFQKMPEGATKSALAVKLFGRNGQELLPLLNSSAESIEELRKKAHELGLVMSDEDVNAAVAYTDAMDTMNRTFTAFKNRLASTIIPAITKGMEDITSYAGKLRQAFEKEGLAGVFQTIVDDIKNIQWPTWDDVWQAAQAAWETIKSGAATLGGLIFGENEKGEVKWPTWESVKETAEGLWEEIKAGAAGLKGLVFGDAENAGQIFESIKSKWDELYNTITQKVIEVGKYFFGEENGDTVVAAVKGIGDAFAAIGSAIATYKLVTGLPKVIETIKGLFAFQTSTNPTAMILSGIAAAVVLIIQNWDKIEPILTKIGGYLDEYVIKPIESVISWIKNAIQTVGEFFGLDIFGSVAKKQGQEIYSNLQNSGKTADDYIAEKYGTGPEAKKAADLASTMQKLEQNGRKVAEQSYENLYEQLAKAAEEANSSTSAVTDLGTAINNLPSEKTIVINTVTNDAGYTPHATGLGYVPFDNYRALLHRGERVLTASQNADYSRGGAQQGVDMTALTNGIINAVHQAMRGIDIRAHVVQHELTESVNRAMSADVKARRFAT